MTSKNECTKYIRKYFKYIFLSIIFMVIQSILSFILPMLIKSLLDNIKDMSNLKSYFIKFFIVFLLTYLFTYIYNIFYIKFRLKFKTIESNTLYNNLFETEYKYIQKSDPSYFVNRISSSATNLFSLLGEKLPNAIVSSLTIVISLFLIVKINPILFFLFLLLLPLNFFSYKKLNKNLQTKSSELQKVCSVEFKNLINSVQNIEHIKQSHNYFGFTNLVGKFIYKSETKNNEVFIYAKKWSIFVDFIINLIKNSIFLLSIYYCYKGLINFSDVVFISMIMNIYFSALVSLTQMNLSLKDVRASVKFLIDEIYSKKEQDLGTKELLDVNNINFNIKDFGYSNNNVVLKDININISKNEDISIVGKSGCGKSTLVKLLLRLYESNDIFINDINIKEYTLKSLRSQIYLLSQHVCLYPGTIKDNIVVGLDHYDEERLNEILNLDFFKVFATLENGVNTEIRENGVNLSGGQKQKVSIARMLMYNPSVIIFDESTSALDSGSEDEIFQDIKQFAANKIIIKISHRISSVRESNKILIIKDGKAIDFDSHDNLLESSEEYIELFGKQLIFT